MRKATLHRPTMNLQEPVIISQSKDEEADTSAWKLIVLALLGVTSGILSSSYTVQFFKTADTHFLLMALLYASIFVIVGVLESFFIKSASILWLLASLEGLSFLSFFVAPSGFISSSIFIGGSILFLFLIMHAILSGRRALLNSLNIHFFEVMKPVVTRVITALLIFVSVFSYVYYVEQNKMTDSIGKVFVNDLLNSVQPIMSFQIPGASFNQMLPDFIKVVATNALTDSNISLQDTTSNQAVKVNFSRLPPAQRTDLINQASQNIEQSLQKDFGTLDMSQNVYETFFTVIKNFVSKFSDTTKITVIISFIILVFFILKGISFVWLWIVEAVSFLIFKLLLATGFAKISTETCSREFVILP